MNNIDLIEQLPDIKNAPNYIKNDIIFDLAASGNFNFSLSIVNRIYINLTRFFKGKDYLKESLKNSSRLSDVPNIFNLLVDSIEDGTMPEWLFVVFMGKLIENGWEPVIK